MKYPVKRITITRAEGPCALCGPPKNFTSFSDANTWLLSSASTFPKDGGYDKHDFSVVWGDPDETSYSGRLDCKHYECIGNELSVNQHILDFARWHSGQAINPWCGAEKYVLLMAQEAPETIQACAELLKKYEL